MGVSVVGGPLQFDAVINNSAFKRQIDEMYTKINGFTDKVKTEASAIDSLARKTQAALGTYFSLFAAGKFARDIVQVRGEFQQLEVAFRTMLRSKEAADKLLAESVELAAKTPFTLSDVGKGAKQLLAFGFGADQITDTLRRLGDVAAGVGAPLGDIAYLFGTMRTQGRAFAIDIRQFAMRGIPIYEELSRVMGKPVEEVNALVSAGKVGFPEVEKAFKNMTSQGGLFFNLMEEQSKTLTGLLSNLSDAWSRMLNDIGTNNESVIASGIRGAIALVDNYQDVLDILKVAVATYGTYRAAILAVTAAQAIQTAATKGYTIAETLRFRAMVISEKAMKLLNATMLSNPWVAGAAAIGGIIAALVIFKKTAAESIDIQKSLNEISAQAERAYTGEHQKLQRLVSIARDEKSTKEERLAAIKQLNQISPKYLGNLTAENVNREEGIRIIDKYIDALRRESRAKAAQEKLTEIDKKLVDAQFELNEKIDTRLGALKNVTLKSGETARNFFIKSDPIVRELIKEYDEYTNALHKQANQIEANYAADLKLNALGEDVNQTKVETVSVIKEKIQKLQEERDAVSSTSAQYKDYTKQIDDLNRQLEKITGKQAGKALQKDLKDRAKDLESFIDELQKAEATARRSGLLKEESELDRINEQYDELLAKSRELGLGPGVEQRIENARKTQTGNYKVRQEVDEYIQGVTEQREAFEKFEEAKREFGVGSARQMYQGQMNEFDTYLAYLEREIEKAFSGRNTLEGQLKLQELGKAYAQAEKEAEQKRIELEQQTFAQALQRSMSFNDERLKLEKEYNEQVAALKKNYTGVDLDNRLKNLKAVHEADLREVDNNAARQSDIYKKLNEDIIQFTRQQVRERINELKKLLKASPDITPEIKASIKSQIDNLENLLDETSRGAEIAGVFGKIAGDLSTLSNGFSSLASSVEFMNAGLADTLQTLGDITNVAASAANAIAQFASGNIIGGIAGVMETLAGVFQIAKKARESEQRAAEEIASFQMQMLEGEVEINRLYRERERDQARINKLKLEGLLEEKKILEQQRKASKEQYEFILKQLQEQSFVAGKTTEQYGGVFGIGKKTRSTEILESLAGKSFEDLEKLFISGQLTGKAKELFELLQQIKKEGEDLDQLLADTIRETQQILTGTTAESITDSIAQGFADGKYAVADFADDFEALMKNAIIQSLKAKALEGPLQKFYEQFALAAESEGALTESEIANLNEYFNSIIENARQGFEDLQKITSVNFGSDSSNSLKGAIQSQLTEQTGSILVGHFAGLRLDARTMLSIATRQVNHLAQIEANTAYLLSIDRRMASLQIEGIKIKA